MNYKWKDLLIFQINRENLIVRLKLKCIKIKIV